MKRKREEDPSDEEEVDLGDDAMDFDLDTIDQLLDQVPEVEALDAVSMKRMLVTFERALTKNTQLRVKYPNQPDKFVESEVDLDEEIKKLQVIATAPALYEDFIGLKAHESIVSLLIHSNTDITCDAIDLIRELTDTEVSEENPEAVTLFCEALLSNQILELLVSNLLRLREKEADERTGIFNVLAVFENLIEVKPEVSQLLGDKTDLVSWLIKRIQYKDFDEIKQYASEMLSILVQNCAANQLRVGRLNGIELLLTVISKYKKINPPTTEEEEFVENVFNALCASLTQPENVTFFNNAEGLKLIQIIIKNKMYARKCALRVLDYVISADPANCKRWILVPGLGTLFSAFMKASSNKRKGFNEREDEEHINSVIGTMFLHLAEEESTHKLFGRLVDKFREKDFQKVERLMELYEKYNRRVNAIDRKIAAEKQAREEDGEELDEEDETNFFLEKLEAGLFTLQKIAITIAFLVKANEEIRTKLTELINFQGSSFKHVAAILQAYADGLGGDQPNEQTEKQRQQINDLIKQFTALDQPQ